MWSRYIGYVNTTLMLRSYFVKEGVVHAIDQLASKAVPEEPKPAAAMPSAEVAVLPPPPSRRITRSQSKVVSLSCANCAEQQHIHTPCSTCRLCLQWAVVYRLLHCIRRPRSWVACLHVHMLLWWWVTDVEVLQDGCTAAEEEEAMKAAAREAAQARVEAAMAAAAAARPPSPAEQRAEQAR